MYTQVIDRHRKPNYLVKSEYDIESRWSGTHVRKYYGNVRNFPVRSHLCQTIPE